MKSGRREHNVSASGRRKVPKILDSWRKRAAILRRASIAVLPRGGGGG